MLTTNFCVLYFSGKIDETGVHVSDIKTIIDQGAGFASDGIAVDWLYKNFYWTEHSADKIMMASYDGQKKKTLVKGGLDNPRAIVADPENG